MSMILSYRRGPICLLLLSMSAPACVPMNDGKGAPMDTKESGHSTGPEDSADSTSGDSAESGTDSGADSGDTGGCPESVWYPDTDHDGFGDPDAGLSACEQPEGTVTNGDDCDDTRADIYPGSVEVCDDGAYNDCDDEHGELAWESCVGDDVWSLASADAKVIGNEDDGVVGITSAGDHNGDGFGDLLISDGYTSGGGLVYLVHGPVSGTINISTAAARIEAASASDRVGTALSDAGDVNADGYREILVGAKYPGIDQAYLISGPLTGSSSFADADAVFGSFDGESVAMGASVAGVGDVDGDGWDDVLLGAPWVDGEDLDSMVGECEEEFEEYGDEYGAYIGGAFLFLGPMEGPEDIDDADLRILGQDGDDYAGSFAVSPGDLNLDGSPDLFVGAPSNCEGAVGGGAAYVVYGGASGELSLADADLRLLATDTDEELGYTGTGAGDMNADGYPDLLVGAPRSSSDEGWYMRGIVRLFDGALVGAHTASDATATLLGADDKDMLGTALAPASDVDLDGFADVLISAPYEDGVGEESGSVWVYFGPISGAHPLSVGLQLTGAEPEALVGGWLSSTDTNGDGYPDLLVSAAGDEEGGTYAGAAYVVLGGGEILSSLGSW